jgi:hypothetical protein
MKGLHRIEIEPAENGAAMSATFRKPRKGSGGGALDDFETKRTVHTSILDLHKHLSAHLKGVLESGEEKSSN